LPVSCLLFLFSPRLEDRARRGARCRSGVIRLR
jgi:hypothetical protein